MAIKVCKLVRLAKKNSKGLFVKDKEGQIIVRSRILVPDEEVAEKEANYGDTGLLYIVDEEATAERNALKSPVVVEEEVKVKPVKQPVNPGV